MYQAQSIPMARSRTRSRTISVVITIMLLLGVLAAALSAFLTPFDPCLDAWNQLSQIKQPSVGVITLSLQDSRMSEATRLAQVLDEQCKGDYVVTVDRNALIVSKWPK